MNEYFVKKSAPMDRPASVTDQTLARCNSRHQAITEAKMSALEIKSVVASDEADTIAGQEA